MKQITIKIPDTLTDQEVVEWVKVEVERHLRAIEKAKVPSVDAIIKPELNLYDQANLKVKEEIEVIEK
jgi:hypothetical protein